MRTSLLAVIASFQALVLARPASQEDVSENHLEVVKRDLGPSWTVPSYCTQTLEGAGFSSIVSALVSESSTSSFDYSSLCSQVVQTTLIATAYTTSSGIITDVRTQTSTTIVSSTSTDKSAATTTLLCPKPAVTSTTPRCGIKANGYSNYLISEQYIGARDCNQLCLSTKSCKSFQTVPNKAPDGEELIEVYLCNLYTANITVAGDIFPGSEAWMYDRDCPDLLPPGCFSTATSTASAAKSLITPKPTLANAVALQKREFDIPPFLSSLVEGERILWLTFACSCLITVGPPFVTYTQTDVYHSFTFTTTTTTQTWVYPFVDYPNLHTKYKTIS